ncbi:MAG: shikimate dehydrogenase, partial [Rhodoglobus sp.]|nr:shikimate dehydrogenase [Rhodoglobus sp.]
SLDPVAAAVGAVNTVLFTADGRVGHNTDTTGFERAYRAELDDVRRGRVVQLAAGGAGAAVADALMRLGAEELVIVDLDSDRARSLAKSVSERHGRAAVPASPDDLADLLRTVDGIVNCSPIGMHNHPGAPFDLTLIHARHWVADIVYRPLHTELLRAASAAGCRTMHGGHMAVGQAADTFHLVTGRAPDLPRMHRHFEELIAAP